MSQYLCFLKTHTCRIIPELVFPQDGLISSVTLGALHRLGGDQLPEIQIWRSSDQTEWFRRHSIGPGAAITYNIHLNVHRYTPSSPVAVLAGDIVGIYQPYTSASRLRVFVQEDGPVNYYRGALLSSSDRLTASGSTERRLPLIHFQFSECHMYS